MRATDLLITLASSNVGSLGGLVVLRDGPCRLTPARSGDGRVHVSYSDKLFGPDADVAVVGLVRRNQGLLVPEGDSLGLTGTDDLT